MYDSPQVDMGYDISDYESVYPPFGTIQDMDELIKACHDRGMRIILDLVINHTSDQHAWFKESRSSKDNPKRDWYIWRPAKYDAQGNRKPPNNWRGNFSGPVWTWDEQSQEYYMHLFCPEQPDLNWENEECRKAIYASSMEFWLKKGVDGFRVDTVNMYSKLVDFPDAPVTLPDSDIQPAADFFTNGPRMHEFLREMDEILSKYDTMTVGELPNTPKLEKLLKYVSAKEKQLSMVFQFDVVDIGTGENAKYASTPRNWKLPQLKHAFALAQELMNGTDAWATVFLENHDQARCVSRFGSDSPEYRVVSAKMLAQLTATLSGTLYLYEGQEIGMVNMPKEWPMEEYLDVESNNYYNWVKRTTNGDKKALEEAHAAIQHLARDNARTPMQWDDSPNAGFTTKDATPWMRVNDSYKDINAASQINDEKSVLSFYKKMLAMRKEHKDVFVYGSFRMFDEQNDKTFTFAKEIPGKTALVVANFSGEETPSFSPPSSRAPWSSCPETMRPGIRARSGLGSPGCMC